MLSQCLACKHQHYCKQTHITYYPYSEQEKSVSDWVRGKGKGFVVSL